jgi:hypothetical protein
LQARQTDEIKAAIGDLNGAATMTNTERKKLLAGIKARFGEELGFLFVPGQNMLGILERRTSTVYEHQFR